MTTPLEQTIAELKARQDIHDALVRYCRGADLCDGDMMRSAYHDDAIDDHGFIKGAPEGFINIAAHRLGTIFTSTKHIVTNETVAFDGAGANVESYILCFLRMTKDEGTFDVTALCRYLDRFECRDGAWKIAERQLVSEGTRIDKVEDDFPLIDQGVRGARGANDPYFAFFSRFSGA